MEEEHRSEGTLRDTAPEPRYRGSNNMYRGVTISVKALTGAILAGLAALALAIVHSPGFPPDAILAFGDVLDRPEVRARHDILHLAFR